MSPVETFADFLIKKGEQQSVDRPFNGEEVFLGRLTLR